MIRQQRRRALPAAAVLALLLAGCGGGTTVVALADAPVPVAPAAAADPKPTPTRTPAPFQVLGGKITVEPTITADPVTLPPRLRTSDPVCPPDKPVPEGVDFEDLQNPNLNAAIGEVSERYNWERFESNGKHFTGLVVCHPGEFFSVYRVPGGSSFDAWINKIAHKHQVTVHLIDTTYSLDVLSAVQDEIHTRWEGAGDVGATIQSTAPTYRDGASWVEVAVEGDVNAARKVLADFGDKVRVVKSTHGGARRLSLTTSKPPSKAAAETPQIVEPAAADTADTESPDVLSQVGRLIAPAKP